MNGARNLARWAGLLYGIPSSVAPFAYLYVPDRIIVPGDALATAERLRASQGLLRAAITAEVCSVTVLIFAALALYELFKRVQPRMAWIMAAMFLVSVPISYVNSLFNIAPLVLLNSPAISRVLDPAQIAAQVTLFLRLHNYGLAVNQIFWGLWLFPIGILVIRSGFFPRWLGWPLFAAGTGYVLNSLGLLALPQSQRWLTQYLQILGVGEMPFFGFYLLIWGVRGYAADRTVVALVLALFVVGMTGLVLLMGHRIDASQYAVFHLVKLVLVIALVMRWRQEAKTQGEAAGVATAAARS